VMQLGMTDMTLLDETVDALIARDGAQLFGVIERVMDAGHEPRRFVSDLLERLRDLIVLQHVPDAAETALIDGPDQQIAREIEQSKIIGQTELSRAADVVNEALSELKGATAPRLQLELMCARLLLPAIDADERGLATRLDQLERRMASAPADVAAVQIKELAAPSGLPAARRLSDIAPSTADVVEIELEVQEATPKPAARPPRSVPEPSTPAAAKVAAGVEKPAPVKESDTPSIADFATMWPAVLDATKAYSRVAWMLFSASQPLSISNGTLAIGVTNAGQVNNARASGHDERMRQAILDVMKVDVRVDVVLDPNAIAPTGSGFKVIPTASAEADSPSMDDENQNEETGVDLAIRALGATQIGEIEH